MNTAVNESVAELLLVSVAGHRYALPVEAVREVLPLVEPRQVPAWPDHALGVIHVRGEPLPLVDVAPSLGLPAMQLQRGHLILVLRTDAGTCGVMVDQIEGLRSAPVRALDAFTPRSVRARAPRCSGMIADDDAGKGGGALVPVLAPSELVAALDMPPDPAVPAEPPPADLDSGAALDQAAGSGEAEAQG